MRSMKHVCCRGRLQTKNTGTCCGVCLPRAVSVQDANDGVADHCLRLSGIFESPVFPRMMRCEG